ncbi:acyltransferase [Muricauda sp. 40Bstr401]|uniref:Acyltransferase n=2 Tax=Flagellimonas sediminis TaxID=2696468 RepID=A0A6I5KW86_9FLAO|nr:acyltransferase [Allomuricauda sediminis]
MMNNIQLKMKKVKYATKPLIRGKIKIWGNGKIILGSHVSFNSGKSYNPIGGDTQMILKTTAGSTIEIGDFTGISNAAIVCFDSITIGKHVKIGGSVKIYDTDFHHLNFLNRRARETDVPITKPVVLKDDCFIGAHSIILKGVTVGERSIVGAGSVVTKSIPDGEIWAGNPAKFIKKIEEI